MKKIKLGLFGYRRGLDLAKTFTLAGADIVAICDAHDDRQARAAEAFSSAKIYKSFDEFIKHPMDGVILANYFHEHAPFAIKCMELGIPVFSECIANATMAEGVALARAAIKYNSIYMLAENYPFMLFNKEMKKVCDGGTLGKILYAEGEYNHPVNPYDNGFKKFYNYFEEHWRNYLPRTYYVTHSLAPIMRATGATPKRVCAFPVFDPFVGDDIPTASYSGDKLAVIMSQNDDGSVFKFTGCAAMGAHHNAYRIAGTNGTIENVRGTDGKIMLRYNDWCIPEGMQEINYYIPDWNDKDEELITKTGHGGGDYLVCREFLDCIRENRQPDFPFDVFSAINMASVAILAHRSVLTGGTPYDIPDFRCDADCLKYENDYESPFYYPDGRKPNIPCCSRPDFKPTAAQVRCFRKEILGEKE